ncbi:MAG: gamma-glutamyltransferase [Acidimicrobiales bacterium]|nr:gamma-glutamyltransferase [Acidimicrobiales bacterium]MCB9394935.1 gamma-glutamyltransferase [Acidimicrobiaceae bacterium]
MSHANGPITGRRPTYAPRGMVTSSHVLASEAGVRVLRAGGSAVDAAIAANAVLCVVYPHMAGLGGDGFWLVGRRGSSHVEALNASGPAGARATIDFYRERDHVQIPNRGAAAVLTVPGAVDGWHQAHERHGKLEWRDLFDDAIFLARHGAPVSRSLSDWMHQDVSVLHTHGAADVFLPGGGPLREGDRIGLTHLGDTLERIAHHGARAGFYDESAAERLLAGLGDDSPLRPSDLSAYHAVWVEPISVDYRGHTIVEFPPNTQGFAALQIMKMLESDDVAAWGDSTFEYYHHMAEYVKIAFADRDAWLTDPDFVDIPLDRLLDADYLAGRRGMFHPERSLDMSEIEPGIVFRPGTDRRVPMGDTCAFGAVDAEGLVVSAIQSIYFDFGSAVLGGDTGVILQNRGSFFSLDDAHPNALQPGKRSFHTLIPGMVLRDGEPVISFGSMGGEGQPQTHAALLTRLIDFGYDAQQAVESPRWLMGRTWGTQSRNLSLEARVPPEVVRQLELTGQPVKMLTLWNDNMGHAHTIRLDPRHDFLEGAADPRGDGSAAGY